MKYIIVNIAHRDGERKYYRQKLLTSETNKSPMEIAKEYFKDFYGDETERDEDNKNVFWCPSGEVCLEIEDAKEITKAEYEVLSLYIN